MKKMFAIAAALSLCVSAVAASASEHDDKVAAGALVALGAAALLHGTHHHADDAPMDETGEAAFEHGYRDGLHDQQYDVRSDSSAYSQGYYAGQKEMNARLSHHARRHEENRAPVSRPAMNVCVGQAANEWRTSVGHVHATKSKASPQQADTVMVELTAGRHVGVCEVMSDGTILSFNNGRL